MADVTLNGMTMEYSVVEGMMDAELKKELESELDNSDEQVFLDAYMEAHKKKFGQVFFQF